MSTAALKFFLPALLAALVVVSGCDWFHDSPESRARIFLETLVREADALTNPGVPVKTADGAGAESVLDGLSTQLAVRFLRARHRQGMNLDFAVTTTQRADPQHRVVRVAVASPPAGVRLEQDSRIHFEVTLELSDAQGWQVTRVRSE